MTTDHAHAHHHRHAQSAAFSLLRASVWTRLAIAAAGAAALWLGVIWALARP